MASPSRSHGFGKSLSHLTIPHLDASSLAYFGNRTLRYGILFAIAQGLISILASNFFLSIWRFETGKPLGTLDEDEEGDNEANIPTVDIPFQKVNLTFKAIHYTVISSITKEELQLLNSVDGFIEAGKMTALMGSSGASDDGLSAGCFPFSVTVRSKLG
jgi:ABC-type transport system involved in Fe-S cluster assembly fused permease/ATPase subunit